MYKEIPKASTARFTAAFVSAVHTQCAKDFGELAKICAAVKPGTAPTRLVRKEGKVVPRAPFPVPQ